MKLFFREAGTGDPVIILHGLLGMSDNWLSVSKILAGNNHVWVPDLRNHGRSPHDIVHDYDALSHDLIEFIQDHSIQNPTVIGHSMGGKVAMKLAFQYPGIIKKLVVVDISPFSYLQKGSEPARKNQHQEILQAMLSMDLAKLGSRTEADLALSRDISSDRIRQFVLKNLHRDNEGKFEWLCNVGVLMRNLPNIMHGVSNPIHQADICELPALFMRGEKSDYITDEEVPLIFRIFRNAGLVNIPGASHWVHADNPEAFLKELMRFLG